MLVRTWIQKKTKYDLDNQLYDGKFRMRFIFMSVDIIERHDKINIHANFLSHLAKLNLYGFKTDDILLTLN